MLLPHYFRGGILGSGSGLLPSFSLSFNINRNLKLKIINKSSSTGTGTGTDTDTVVQSHRRGGGGRSDNHSNTTSTSSNDGTRLRNTVNKEMTMMENSTSKDDHHHQRQPDIMSNPIATKLQQFIHSQSSSSGGWGKCWDEGLIPWDLGRATPIVVHLHQTGALAKGRVLVPGCGSGHDVVAMACPEHYVVGVDISEKAIRKAIELSSSLPNVDYLTFLKADFFAWHPTELFDLIFDYTFFCAVEPDMRLAWASQMRALLKPEGELITLMFPISDHIGGPPYKVSVADYEEVLHPMGFRAVSVAENELAIGPRRGREKLGRWKKLASQSSL